MSGLKRAALIFGVVALLLLADGIYLVASNKNPNGDTGTLFGNPHYFLSSGTIVLISGLLVLVAAVVMWLVDVRREDQQREQRRRPAGDPSTRERPPVAVEPAEDPPAREQPEPSGRAATPAGDPPTREQPGPSGRTAQRA